MQLNSGPLDGNMLLEDRERQAALWVAYEAIVLARGLAWSAEGSLRHRVSKGHQRHVADLLSAVHNIPLLLATDSDFNLERLRAALDTYDSKWGDYSPICLRAILEEALCVLNPSESTLLETFATTRMGQLVGLALASAGIAFRVVARGAERGFPTLETLPGSVGVFVETSRIAEARSIYTELEG